FRTPYASDCLSHHPQPSVQRMRVGLQLPFRNPCQSAWCRPLPAAGLYPLGQMSRMLNLDHRTLKQISLNLAASGFSVGLLLTLGLLSADSAGRVNLLYLLLLFAFIPAVSLLISLVFGFRKSAGGGFAGTLLNLPIWPRQWQRELLILAQTP